MSRCDEYCDNLGCNRGPGCYGRADCADTECPGHPGAPAKVARVGRRDYDRDPLPRSSAPRYLKHLAKWMLICIGVMLLTALGAAYA